MTDCKERWNEEGIKPSAGGGKPQPEGARVPGRAPERGTAVRSEGGAAAPAHSLDIINISEQCRRDGQKAESEPKWTPNKEKRKAQRLYHYMRSGIRYHASERLLFITFTSSPHSPKDITHSFKRMTQKIRRTTVQQLVDNKWVTLKQAARYYAGKDADESLRFEYLGNRTNEGFGVIHLLAAGDYIPQKFLSHYWSEYHKAPIVSISDPGAKNKKKRYNGGQGVGKAMTYIVGQYIKNQAGYTRMIGPSKGWLYPGEKAEFRHLIKQRKAAMGDKAGYEFACKEWDVIMYSKQYRPIKGYQRLVGLEVIKEQERRRKQHHETLKGHYKWIHPYTRDELMQRVKDEYGG